MRKFREFLSKKRKGMTLIELMAVILIIGIVFGYGVVTIGNNTEKAKYARAMEDISALATAMQLTAAEVGDSAVFPGGAAVSDLTGVSALDTRFAGHLDKPIDEWLDPWGAAVYDVAIDADGVATISPAGTDHDEDPEGHTMIRTLKLK